VRHLGRRYELASISGGGAGVQPAGHRRAVRHPNATGMATAQSAGTAGPVVASGAEYGHQFRQQHRLAGLRRGKHHQPLQHDDGADRAELPLRGDRFRGAVRTDSRVRPSRHRQAGQRVARPDANDAVRTAAAVSAGGAIDGQSGRTAKLQPLSDLHYA